MKFERSFVQTDRYAFDDKLTSKAGYAQIDSYQDAWYYGAWCNPFERKIVSYAEGDLTIATAETDEEFAEHIRSMDEWDRKAGHGGLALDPWCNQKLAQKLRDVGLGNLLH